MIYLNNAATSFPKPDCVSRAVAGNLAVMPENPYRDGHLEADAGALCRQRLAALFAFDDPSRVVLCSGATEALNLAIHGLVKDGGHVVTTQIEHNSMLRPLFRLRNQKRIDLTIVPCDNLGRVAPETITAAMTPATCLVAVNHASNVTGAVQNAAAIYKTVAARGVPLLLDASQSAGNAPLDLTTMPLAVVAFTGHKALLGPAGVGGMLVGRELKLAHWKVGGTGIRSDLEGMPDLWPLQYEPGTPNYPGIAGLAAAVEYLLAEKGSDKHKKKVALVAQLESELAPLPGVNWHAAPAAVNHCGVASFTLAGWRCKDVGYILGESYGIRVRTGLHCAPLIHQALGTSPEGTVRVSFSRFNTPAEVKTLVQAVTTLLESR